MTHKRRTALCSRPHSKALCSNRELPSDCCVILDSITDGVFAVDRELRIVSMFNRAAEQITGYSLEEAIGQYCFDIFRSAVCQTGCPLKRTLATGEHVYDYPSVIINKAGAEVSVNISTALIRDNQGAMIGAVEIFRDLSVVETLRNVISGKYRLRDLLSKNHRLQEIFEILPDIAESDSTVLIQGPSGSGKEVVATAIHDLSYRKDQPFVKMAHRGFA